MSKVKLIDDKNWKNLVQFITANIFLLAMLFVMFISLFQNKEESYIKIFFLLVFILCLIIFIHSYMAWFCSWICLEVDSTDQEITLTYYFKKPRKIKIPFDHIKEIFLDIDVNHNAEIGVRETFFIRIETKNGKSITEKLNTFPRIPDNFKISINRR